MIVTKAYALPKWFKSFVVSAGFLLGLTAVAKLTSSLGSQGILQTPDPIFMLPFRHVFIVVGILELEIACTCLFCKKALLQTALIAWLSTGFLIYRMGLLLVGYYKPCHCLGNLTDILHIPPQTADTAMKVVLGYLLIGSYAALFWIWKQGRKSTSLPQATIAVP